MEIIYECFHHKSGSINLPNIMYFLIKIETKIIINLSKNFTWKGKLLYSI